MNAAIIMNLYIIFQKEHKKMEDTIIQKYRHVLTLVQFIKL